MVVQEVNMCVSEICEKYNIKMSTIYARKRRHNCSTEEAVLYYLDKMRTYINQREYYYKEVMTNCINLLK